MNFASCRNLACACLLLALPGAAVTLPWDKDMQDQPSIKAQESLVRLNPGSVPVGGKDGYPPPEDVIELVRARLDAGRTLLNPIAKSPESLERGRELYALHCLVCHGPQGRGNGPVGQKFVPQPMELNFDYVQLQPDGQLFYTISHGSLAMPFYRQAIAVEDRWHLVNFIKEVFGEQ
ncbi:MAG: cytochrome c [Woeseiaceae bacterium]|nr:cytochrome c [Woeseiaceae bacterium]